MNIQLCSNLPINERYVLELLLKIDNLYSQIVSINNDKENLKVKLNELLQSSSKDNENINKINELEGINIILQQKIKDLEARLKKKGKINE